MSDQVAFRWLWFTAVFSEHGPDAAPLEVERKSRDRKSSRTVVLNPNKPSLVAVCGALFTKMAPDGSCTMSGDEIETACGLSRQARVNATQWLEARGWLQVGRAGIRGQKWRQMRYSAQLPQAALDAVTEEREQKGRLLSRRPSSQLEDRGSLPSRRPSAEDDEARLVSRRPSSPPEDRGSLPSRRPSLNGPERSSTEGPKVVYSVDDLSSSVVPDVNPTAVAVGYIPDGTRGDRSDGRDGGDGGGGDGSIDPNGTDPEREAAVEVMGGIANRWIQKRVKDLRGRKRKDELRRLEGLLRPIVDGWDSATWTIGSSEIPWAARPERLRVGLAHFDAERRRELRFAVKLAVSEKFDPLDSPRPKTEAAQVRANRAAENPGAARPRSGSSGLAPVTGSLLELLPQHVQENLRSSARGNLPKDAPPDALEAELRRLTIEHHKHHGQELVTAPP
jgi:hypothetical protein